MRVYKFGRIISVVIATLLIAGIVIPSLFTITKDTATEKLDAQSRTLHESVLTKDSEARNLANNAWLKINELWRLSLNSEVDYDIRNTASLINAAFDIEALTEFLTRAKDDQIPYEKIIDEYLASITLETDLSLYFDDNEAYEAEKQVKILGNSILTMNEIESLILELSKQKTDAQIGEINTPDLPSSSIPNAPQVNASPIVPINPADEIKAETEQITQNAIGVGVKQ